MPVNTPNGRVRQQRTVYSVEQREKLDRFFQNNHYPSYEERETLAASLNLREQQVQVWFKNRRAKYRKSQEATQQPGGAADASSQDPGDAVPGPETMPAPSASGPEFPEDLAFASTPMFYRDVLAPGFSGVSFPPGYFGVNSPRGFSGEVKGPGFSGVSFPPEYFGVNSPRGFSGEVKGPGFSGVSFPPEYFGVNSPCGFSGEVRTPGFPGKVKAPGFSRDALVPGFSGDATVPGGTASMEGPGFHSPPPPYVFGGMVAAETSTSSYMQVQWDPTQDAQNPVPAAAPTTAEAAAPDTAPVCPEDPCISGFGSDLLESPTLADLLSSRGPLQGPSSSQSGCPKDEDSGSGDDSGPKFLDL